MYKNVGSELKVWAKAIAIIAMVPFFMAAVGFLTSGGEFLNLLIAVVVAFFGYVIGRLSGILLYAFGELVENSTSIKEKLSEIETKPPSQFGGQEAKTQVHNPVNGWTCITCGCINDSGRFCARCGSPKMEQKKSNVATNPDGKIPTWKRLEMEKAAKKSEHGTK